MKSVVVYYSYSGNTHRVAQVIGDILREKGDEVVPVRIRPLKEEKNFFTQCLGAFFALKPDIYRTLLDLRGFDRIVIGSPVWAFKPVPAINTYLDRMSLPEGKEAICFVTCGSGAGKSRTLEIMKRALVRKGARSVKTASFQQAQPAEETRREFEKLL